MSAYNIEISNRISIANSEGRVVKNLPYGYIEVVLRKYKDISKKNWLVNTPSLAPIIPGVPCINIKDMLPRAFQQKVLDGFTRTKLVGSVKAPTGSGKTNMVAYLIAKRNVRTVVIVPTSDLVEQTRNRFLQILDIDEALIGTLSSKSKDFDAPILITTWQSFVADETLAKVVKGNYGQVICDEWHKASADVYNKAVDSIPALYKHGFSASPYRNNVENEAKMKEITGSIFQEVDIEELYEDGFLVRPTIFKVQTGIRVDPNITFAEGIVHKKIKSAKYCWFVASQAWSDGKKVVDSLGEIISVKELATNIKHVQKLINEAIIIESKNANTNSDVPFEIKIGAMKKSIDNNRFRKGILNAVFLKELEKENENAVILFNTTDAALEAQEFIKENGYKNTILITGKVKNKSQLIKDLNTSKNYIVFGTLALLGEGVDVPSLKKVFCASPAYPPFCDTARLQQLLGRPVRPEDGKDNCYMYLFDDDTAGWIDEKKNTVYNIAFSEMNPILKDYGKVESILCESITLPTSKASDEVENKVKKTDKLSCVNDKIAENALDFF